MREQIILAPGANSGELTKTLAMHGINCFNLRICGAGELARLVLMRSGIAIKEDFISSREETAIISEAVKGEKYFGKTTYSDIREIAKALRLSRSLVPDGDEEKKIDDILGKGLFTEKNAALIRTYHGYKKILKDRNLIDSVSLIRKALAECKEIDSDFYVLKEYPLNPLERALINKLSGGRVQVSDLQTQFGVTTSALRIESYKNCYGAPNEVENILTDIYSGKTLDKCTVAVTDASTYGQLFFDYALLYDMPITFGCGIPIINSNPARLLVLYYKWMTGGFFGAASLETMFSSPAFDRKKLYDMYPEADKDFSWNTFHEVLGGIRLTNDTAINKKRLDDFKKAVSEEEMLTDPNDKRDYRSFIRKKLCIPYLEVLSKELSLPAEDFILKYAYIRKGTETNAKRLIMGLDMAASTAIYEELKIIKASGAEQSAEDMITNVLKLSVASGKSEEGKLFVTGIDGVLSSVRENLYIAGLSAGKYPGSPRENYLLLDADINLFGKDAEYLTSDGRITLKRDRLLALAHLASDLGSSIHVSYAGLNVSELKKDNASSLIYELFREENGKTATSKEMEDHIEKVDYFAPAISVTRNVGRAYNDGKIITPCITKDIRDAAGVHGDLEREYSPSALESFFACPRKFMLSNVLGIPEPDDEKPFEVMAANERGNLAHLLMEKLGNSTMTLDEFLKLSETYFERFISEHPPLVAQNTEEEKDLFLDMMETAYNMDPHREVVLKEENVHCTHENGVKIHGYPDRIEKLDDGSYLVVDFKSGRTLSHVEDDIDTCLQIVIYAYLMEQKGYKISGGEFRYVRLGETVPCKYDDEMKRKLKEKLDIFKQCMESGDFPISDLADTKEADEKDPCEYCTFSMICGKE